jgi:hypothetical protein
MQNFLGENQKLQKPSAKIAVASGSFQILFNWK